jgi:hypothetical protein
MDSQIYSSALLIGGYDDGPTSPSSLPKTNPLSNKLTSILSTSFADGELRDALRTLDQRGVQNTPETRRNLRLDAQREVIDRNGDVIQDFGHVAEVCPPCNPN